MNFYYLHKLEEVVPKNENGFDYIVYSEKKIDNPLTFKNGERFCSSHHPTGDITWTPNDERIEVIHRHSKQIIATFTKCNDETGFTTWKNIRLL